MNDLVPLDQLGSLAKEYRPMLSVIGKHRGQVACALTQHGKSHTQFQYAMLDNAGPIAGPTKLRNMRQILAVIERTEAALQEAYFNREEKLLDIEEAVDAHTERGRLLIRKLESEIQRIGSSIAGAIRKLAAYYEQYAHLEAQLKEELGRDVITEADFEADEERFHIMKAFEQALCSARASGGAIDHGNFIYLHDIGINGACAQIDLLTYLKHEDSQIKAGRDVHYLHKIECEFLDKMAQKYKGCAKSYAARKGLLTAPSATATLGIES